MTIIPYITIIALGVTGVVFIKRGQHNITISHILGDGEGFVSGVATVIGGALMLLTAVAGALWMCLK